MENSITLEDLIEMRRHVIATLKLLDEKIAIQKMLMEQKRIKISIINIRDIQTVLTK